MHLTVVDCMHEWLQLSVSPKDLILNKTLIHHKTASSTTGRGDVRRQVMSIGLAAALLTGITDISKRLLRARDTNTRVIANGVEIIIGD